MQVTCIDPMKKLLLVIVYCIGLCSQQAVATSPPPCNTVTDTLIAQLNYHAFINSDTTLLLADSLLSIANACDEDTLRAHAYRYIGDGYYTDSELDSALIFYNKALFIYKIKEDSVNQMETNLSIANVYSELGQVNVALEHYLRVLPYLNQKKDTSQLALLHYNISLLFFDQDNLKGAKRRLLLAKSMLDQSGDRTGIYSDILQMLGHLAYLNDHTDSARILLKKSLHYADSTYLTSYQAYVFANFALISINEEKYDSALDYASRAIDMARMMEDKFSMSSYYNIAADAAYRLGNMAQAERLVDSAMYYAKMIESKILRQMAYQVSADMYAYDEQFEKAYRYLDSAKTLEDSIRKQDAESALLQHEREMRIAENLRLQQANRYMQQQRKFRERQLKERSTWLLIIAILLTILLIVAAYLFHLSQKRKHLNQAKDTILSVISHDLRGPIVQLKSLGDLLYNEKLPKATQQQVFQNFQLAIANLQKSFENILFWSKGQMQGIQPHPKAVLLKKALQETCDFHQPALDAKEIEMECLIPDDATAWVDPNHLQIILRNALSNAIKFSQKGKKIAIHVIKDEYLVFIKIKDFGVGISPEDLQKIMNRRTSLSRMGTQNERGTGLGVQLSRQFAKVNKGNFELHSIQGEGTTVILTLPAHPY